MVVLADAGLLLQLLAAVEHRTVFDAWGVTAAVAVVLGVDDPGHGDPGALGPQGTPWGRGRVRGATCPRGAGVKGPARTSPGYLVWDQMGNT